ncbi:hypothetical protein [Hyalangium gracile]|uniref:hypothetical protein n=1 Tax=Hyalangium gracile TaxID=394092 RepID=UPI001CCACA6B|nr:hypothetical protein [Hyalangium gracile]
MKETPRTPTSAILFHGVALAFFSGCAVWLVRESQRLGGRQGLIDLGVAVASGGLALLSLLALFTLLRARALVVLRTRAEVGTYLQVLAAMVVLGLGALHLLSTDGRPALAGFCLGLAGWLCGIGLHLIPALFLASDGFIDHLGKRTRFSELEWFQLQKTRGDFPRSELQAGRGNQLRLQARLVGAEHEELRRTLLQAGLSARAPGR